MSIFQNVAPGVCFSPVPNRASDAGPESKPTPHNWHYHVDDLLDEVRGLDRLYLDDPLMERRMALATLSRIKEWAATIEQEILVGRV